MTSYTSGVGVAQLAEHWIVAPVVAGSSPVAHPPIPSKPKHIQPVVIGALRSTLGMIAVIVPHLCLL